MLFLINMKGSIKLEIRTKRLIIRPLVLSDYKVFHKSFTEMLPQKNAGTR
jgi:hypothetical protein